MSTPADSNLVGRYASAQELIDAAVPPGLIDHVDQPIKGNSNSDEIFDYLSPYILSWQTTGGGPDVIRGQRGNVSKLDLIIPRAAENANATTIPLAQISDERIDPAWFVAAPGSFQGDIGPLRNAAQKADQRKVSWLKKL